MPDRDRARFDSLVSGSDIHWPESVTFLTPPTFQNQTANPLNIIDH